MDDIEAGGAGGGAAAAAAAGGGGGGTGVARIPLAVLSAASPASLPRLRVLVLGDASAGKSALVARLSGCSVQDVARSTEATTGCATECRLYQYTGSAGPIGPTPGSSQHASYGSNGTSHVAQLHAGSLLQHRSNSLSHSPGSLMSSVIGGLGSGGATAGSATTSLSSPASSSSLPLVWLELLDVSGHRKYEASRALFYRDIHALVLVFDLMNRKSYENIARWIKEVVRADRDRGPLEEPLGYDAAVTLPAAHSRRADASPHHSPALHPTLSPSSSSPPLGPASSDPAQQQQQQRHLAAALGQLPVLLIGTKNDEYRTRMDQQGTYECQRDYGLDSIYLSALDPREDLSRLDRFFDRVVARRLQQHRPPVYRNDSSMTSAAYAGAGSSYYAASASAGYGYAAPAYPSAPSDHLGLGHRRPSGHAASLQLPPRSAASYGSGYSVAGFVPPPIRSLADFTDGGGGGGGSGSGASSPSGVIGPSSDEGYDAFPVTAAAAAPEGRFGRSAAYEGRFQQPPPQPGSFSSLPTNTALHALTQQRNAGRW